MSIYPVPLAKWYRPKPLANDIPQEDRAEEKRHQKIHWEAVVSIARSSKCCRCGRTPKATAMIADHSLPWGYWGEVWCSARCFRRKPRTRYFERDHVEARGVEEWKRRNPEEAKAIQDALTEHFP